MEEINVKAILELDFEKGEFGALACAGDVLALLPEGVRINKTRAEAIYKKYCALGFNMLSESEVLEIIENK